jgi:multicomponent Na+:H+ antiporter subunit D
MNSLIPLFIIIPLATAFIIPIIGKITNHFAKFITPIMLLILCYFGISLLLSSTQESYVAGGWQPVKDIPIGIYLVLDGFSKLILCIISVIGFLVSIYAISYISKYTSENNFYALFCLMIAGMNGVVLSGDIFNLFVFLEISVIASYALVAFGVGKNELEASFKYQVLGNIASFLILFSIALLYWQTKTLNIADISDILQSHNNSVFLTFTQILLITGFGLKAAIIPFHAWLPDAHSSAPSPVSAMLSGVLIKAIGVYVIIRLFFNMFVFTHDIAIVISVMGTLSMIIGSLLAINQKDIKRLLAYSSISQIGYIILGFGIGMMVLSKGGKESIAVLAISGSLFHMINHSVFKGLLFLGAGAIEYRTNTRDMDQLGGLAENMPITSTTSLGASMSISGIPPFNGFFSKLIIIIAAVQAKFYILAALAVVVSIITLAYFLKYQKSVFYGENKNFKNIKEVPFAMSFSMIILVMLCLGLSALAIPSIREIVLDQAVNSLIDMDKYINLVIHN